MIILGSHGRKGFQHFVLGSVAEEVMRKAPCTVEIVKERKEMETSFALEMTEKETKGKEQIIATSGQKQ